MSILEKLVFKEDWDGEKSEFNLKDLLDTSDSKKLTNDIKIELEVYLGDVKLYAVYNDLNRIIVDNLSFRFNIKNNYDLGVCYTNEDCDEYYSPSPVIDVPRFSDFADFIEEKTGFKADDLDNLLSEISEDYSKKTYYELLEEYYDDDFEKMREDYENNNGDFERLKEEMTDRYLRYKRDLE